MNFRFQLGMSLFGEYCKNADEQYLRNVEKIANCVARDTKSTIQRALGFFLLARLVRIRKYSFLIG